VSTIFISDPLKRLSFDVLLIYFLRSVFASNCPKPILSNEKIISILKKGFGMTVAPLYITEIAPSRVRGSFGACFQLFVAIGVLLAQVLGLDIILGQKHLWNYLFGLLLFSLIL
jgi:hypothetical protein